ncbi:MAG: transcriptional activator RfaH [Rhodospirillaceae bacterium]|nr:transcriptional activator RfaH [Rhodospirillaceae bacterium]
MSASTTRWYVVHARPHQERRAEENLRRQGYRVWLPVMARSRRHARRIETVRVPLFPGYLFVALDLARDRWRAINGTFGVRRLVANGARPMALPEEFVASLHGATGADGLSTMAPADLQPGDAVTIVSGPFTEYAAVILRLGSADRVEVLLDILGGRVPARLSRRALVAAA